MQRVTLLLVILLGAFAAVVGIRPTTQGQDTPRPAARVSDEPNDWPMYNRDVIGTRHNSAERALSRENVSKLVEKWRFPPDDAGQQIGVVHATVVVNGHVYFGTETTPTVYKLTPDGRVKWSFPPRGEAKPDDPRPQHEGLQIGRASCR